MHAPRNLNVKEDKQIILLIIDPQIDFHEGGSLAVPGSTEDAKRIARMIMDHLDDIGEIFVTLDSHHKKHIAHAAFWSDKEDGSGKAPAPFTLITHQDLVDKKWFPKDLSLTNHCLSYAKKLKAAKNNFDLTIWPDHCLIGTVGHAVQDDIHAALRVWSEKNFTKTVKYIHKGMNCLTEMYSAIEAEVPIKTDPSTTLNTELLRELQTARRLLICGQAKSHCVNFTTRDIAEHWLKGDSQNQRSYKDIYILEDGCSSVQSPVVDFEKVSQKFITDMKERGLVVTTIARAFEGLERK
eukprot:gene22312-30556_t